MNTSRALEGAPQGSRFRKGTTTFGPVGRISWTVVVVVLPIFVGVFGGIGGILFLVIWGGVIAPMALKDIWKKDWVYVPGQRTAPPSTVSSFDGKPVASLSDYVASQGPPPPPPRGF